MHVIDLAVYVWRTHTTAQPFSVQKSERKSQVLEDRENARRDGWRNGEVSGREKPEFSARSCQMTERINICAKICA